jgi:tRNA-dihydrouridine synthase
MGCPDKAVVKSGGGSALIKDFAKTTLAKETIAATKTAGLPVSVKTRLGYGQVEEWHDWLEHLLEQDLACLTVHLRTKKEMSKVPAHHELISGVTALRDTIAPQTLLVFNGDIADRLQGQSLKDKYPGVDGIMIGRGVFANPFCFEKQPRAHSREELVGLLNCHLELFDLQGKSQPKKFSPLKRFFKIYINGFPGASDLRAKLMNANTTSEVRSLLAGFFSDQPAVYGDIIRP